MTYSPAHALERFWSTLLGGDAAGAAAMVEPGGSWDDPLFDRAEGEAVQRTAIPRLAAWVQGKASRGPESIRHLRTIADERRILVETVLDLKDGLIWDQAAQRAEKAERFELATALVADRSSRSSEAYQAIRIYFGTWSVMEGKPKLRLGPICPDERERTKGIIGTLPTVGRYFECLATANAEIIDMFEPDGYFREPASNFACGRDQLTAHFQHILTLGGVGVEFLTATRQDDTIGFELQTVVWGTKRMDRPQAGFAAYDLGPHGKLRGARVYDSVVPPAFS